MGILNFIPNLFAIIIIFTLTRYFVKFLGALFAEIEKGKLNVDGFYPEWIKPTYNILRIVIYAFMFIIIFPYLPGSDSPVFQGVSVFFGLLLSLGSTSAISNLVAGLVITYMRPFQIGDRVQIGDILGEVTEKNLLVTRLRTSKNEDVTVPNSNILSTKNMNFSTSSKNLGLILHTEVTIGYDIPWKQVHELLINAAEKTNDVLKVKPPFVLQTNLSDFYVSYELNAYTNQPKKMAGIYSDLHQHIQDEFNKAGIEILSPHYEQYRKDVHE
jgi:small-conductance mechanosensitive channel